MRTIKTILHTFTLKSFASFDRRPLNVSFAFQLKVFLSFETEMSPLTQVGGLFIVKRGQRGAVEHDFVVAPPGASNVRNAYKQKISKPLDDPLNCFIVRDVSKS